MEDLELLYKELQERKEHLENRKKTSITNGRLAENLLTLVRIQELLIKHKTQPDKKLRCQFCNSKNENGKCINLNCSSHPL